jgi:hypothetical protein
MGGDKQESEQQLSFEELSDQQAKGHQRHRIVNENNELEELT